MLSLGGGLDPVLNQQDGVFLRRTFSQFLPDVFSHPLWLGFIEEHVSLSPTIIQELMFTARQLQSDGNIQSACQVWFLCAALQKQIGDQVAALNSIQQVWRLAEIHDLQQVSRWAAWGASALCFILEDDQQAGRYLEWLQQDLSAKGEWMTANLVYLLKSTILHQTEERPGIRILLSWLRLWGELNPFMEGRERASVVEKVSSKARPWVVSSLLFYNGGWHSFWQTLKRIANRTLYLKRVENDGSTHTALYPQAQLPTAFEPTKLLTRVVQPSSLHISQRSTPSQLYKSPQIAPSVSPLDQTGQAPSLAVYCLGPLRIYRNDCLIENWSSKKGQSIFKYLVMHRDSLAQKDLLMDTFWPDADPEAARRNLHQAIYSLRQTFNLGNSEFQYIQFWNDGYRLNPILNIWVDYEEFEQHVQAGQLLEERNKVESAMAEYGIAEGLYQDDFLTDDPYEEWCQSRRRYLLQTYLSTASRLARYYLKCGEHAATIALSRRILSKDNCQEEAHQYLMRCYLEQGQRHLALSQYQLCVQLLRDELGLSPSAETQNLYLQIDQG